jgi:hypothetical protein
MKAIFTIVIFSIVLNIATGIMSVAVTDFDGNQVFATQDKARLPSYQENGTDYFVSTQNSSVNPAGVTEDKGNLVFRLLDLISLGFINRMIAAIDYYLFYWVNFLDKIFGQFMNNALHEILFGIPELKLGVLKILTSFVYIIAAFELWTNKQVVE